MNSKLVPINRVLTIILSILLIVSIASLIIGFSQYNKELEGFINTNNELSVVNEKLNREVSQIKSINYNLTNDNKTLNTQIQELNIKIDELENNNKELKEKISQLEKTLEESQKNHIVTPSTKDFKSYLPYDAITNQWSQQWKLQQQAYTNEDGIRCINGIPMVAVGTGWGLSIGDIALVTCDNGNSFKVMIGDIKADIHTDETNKTTIVSGCRCEFIVELNKLDPHVRSMGSLAVLEKYSGYVINIEKIS